MSPSKLSVPVFHCWFVRTSSVHYRYKCVDIYIYIYIQCISAKTHVHTPSPPEWLVPGWFLCPSGLSSHLLGLLAPGKSHHTMPSEERRREDKCDLDRKCKCVSLRLVNHFRQQIKSKWGQDTHKVSSKVFSRRCTKDVPYLLWTDDPEIQQFIDPKTWSSHAHKKKNWLVHLTRDVNYSQSKVNIGLTTRYWRGNS